MHESDVVVGDDAVSKGRKALLHPLDHHRVRQGVSEVLQLLICCCVGNQQPSLVTWFCCVAEGGVAAGGVAGKQEMSVIL